MKKLLLVTALVFLIIGCSYDRDNVLVYEVTLNDDSKLDIIANGYYAHREGFWEQGKIISYSFHYNGSSAGTFNGDQVKSVRIKQDLGRGIDLNQNHFKFKPSEAR